MPWRSNSPKDASGLMAQEAADETSAEGMGRGRSSPGWFRYQSGVAWDCFKTRSRNTVPDVSGPRTCYLLSVERPFKGCVGFCAEIHCAKFSTIPTSCKMRSQVGEEGRNREGKQKQRQEIPPMEWCLRPHHSLFRTWGIFSHHLFQGPVAWGRHS